MDLLEHKNIDIRQYICCVSRFSNLSGHITQNAQQIPRNVTELPAFIIPEGMCNATTELTCQQFPIFQGQPLNFKIVFIIIHIILFVIGSTGNICVILCVTLFRNMRTISHVFLLNLACSDLLVILICEPFSIARLISDNWIFGELLCRLNGVFQGTSVGVSILTLTSVCIERYVVIVGKGFNHNRFNSKHLIAWVIGIWLTAFIITSPLFQAYEVKEQRLQFSEPIRFCLESWFGHTRKKQIFTTTIFILFYLLPLLFMFVLYNKVGIHLRRSTNVLLHIEADETVHSFKGRTSSHAISVQSAPKLTSIKGLNNTRQRISSLLMILTLLFAIFWLPYHVLNLFFDFILETPESKIKSEKALESSRVMEWLHAMAYPMAQILSYVNNAINPLCTLMISKKFRTVLNRLRKCQLGTPTNSKLSKAMYCSQTVNTGYKNY